MQSPDIPSAKTRPRLSIAAAMGAVLLAALACKWPMQAIPFGAMAAIGIAIRRFSPRRLRAYGLALAALYAPATIGLTLDCGHCRETWAAIWPVVPGGIIAELARMACGSPRLSDATTYALAAAITPALILAATAVAARGRIALGVTLAACGLFGAWAFAVAAAAIRM